LRLPVGDPAGQVLVVEESPTPLSETPRNENAYFVDAGHSLSACVAGADCGAGCKSEKCQTDASDSNPSSRQRRKQKASEGPKQSTASRVVNPKNDWAGRLSQLHARLVPYSGLIVALALVTSASLLYWLTLAPAGTPTEYPGIHDTSHWPSVASSEVAVPQPTADHGTTASISEPVLPVFSVPSDESPLRISESVADVSSHEATNSDLEKIILPPQDANDDLQEPLFPSTDFSSPDFSLIGVSPLESTKQDSLEMQPIAPAVADRNLNAPTSPVRR